MKAKNLILFTNGFPCVKEGEEFLEKELELLSLEFKSIYIYVLTNNEICRSLPSNVEVKFLKKDSNQKIRAIFLKYFVTIVRIIVSDIRESACRKTIFENFKFYRDVLIGNFLLKNACEREISEFDLKETKLYSYWCGPWFDILMLMNKKITDNIVFRAHGYDFDVNQHADKCIPYRNYLIKKNPFICFVSQYGYNTYGSKYPNYNNKKLYRLGVSGQTVSKVNLNSNEVTIVSCSSLIELKRVNLIVEILKHVKAKIKWIHFGDGSLLNLVKKEAEKLKENVSVEFKGQVLHDEIIKYYKDNHIDLFVNVSELEGIPVSIMEAISFGIPVTGCNVCGVPEIVTKETGFLWDVNFEPEEAANQLDDYFKWSDQRKQSLRLSTRNYWSKNFDADINYKLFIKECLLN